MRAALAEALGDNTLQLAYWVPERGDYVDERGRPARIDPPPKDKIVTLIEHEGRAVAAIIHVTDLADEPELLRNVGAAAALTSGKRAPGHRPAREAGRAARLAHAHCASRRRPAPAHRADLHDGAQQRLMALGINLRLARERVDAAPGEAVELIDESLRELGEATAELRELARGIHPAVLTERGLAAAITGLAGRSPVPVKVLATPIDRLPSSVESAIYFIVAEALTNAGRYADAQNVTVSVARHNGDVMSRSPTMASAAPRSIAVPACAACRTGRGPRRRPRTDEHTRSRHDSEREAAVRVIVAEDSVLLREGVVRLLGEAGFEVVAQAGDGDELLRKAAGAQTRCRRDRHSHAPDAHRRGHAGSTDHP